MGAVSFHHANVCYKWPCFLPNSSFFVEAKPDPLFWVKIFVSTIVLVVSGTPHGTKRFTTHHKLILEVDEPEADQFFWSQEKCQNTPQALCYYSYSMQRPKGSCDTPG